MKKQTVTLILFLVVNLLQAQNPLVKQWDYRYGGTNMEVLNSFQQTTDGGYILGGRSNSDISGDKTQNIWGNHDYWIIKIDSLGNKQWDKDFGGTDTEWLFSLQQTYDGGYILGGYSESGIGGDKTQPIWGGADYWIVKTDSLGNKQWDKDFGGTGIDELYFLRQTSDKGFILGGKSTSGIGGDKTQATIGYEDYWIVKTDSLGNKQWDKDFGGTSGDFLYSLQQTTEGGYILGGWSGSGIGGDKSQPSWGVSDYWIVKIDSLGNKQWDKDFGGTSNDLLRSLWQTTDGGYILGGYSWSGISGDKTQDNWDVTDSTIDYWIIKIDSIGNKQWDKVYGGTDDDAFNFLHQTSDSGYLLSGASYSNISGNKTENNFGLGQTWLVKTDSLGIKQWDKTIFTNGNYDQGLAYQLSGACYAIANFTIAGIGGYKTQQSRGNYDYWIIKFCDTTLTTSVSQKNNSQLQTLIFPNPVHDKFTITTNNNTLSEIILYDITSRKLFHQQFTNSLTLNTSHLSKGIYFYEVLNKNGVIKKGKVVKD